MGPDTNGPIGSDPHVGRKGGAGSRKRDRHNPGQQRLPRCGDPSRLDRGGGVEWAFWDNWSAGSNTTFTILASTTLTDSLAASMRPPADVNQQIHAVAFGVNYRFNFGKAPAAVVARY